MATKIERLELTLDFILIGISTQLPAYKVCFELNQKLQLSLTKQVKPHPFFIPKRMLNADADLYSYYDGAGINYRLIKNKAEQGLVVPELKQIDYLLCVHDMQGKTTAINIYTKIKTYKQFLGVFNCDVNTLKSKDNLYFDE